MDGVTIHVRSNGNLTLHSLVGIGGGNWGWELGGPIIAKNGDEQFWNIEISCSQWEGSACIQSALILFFSFKFWVAVWKGFFSLWGCNSGPTGHDFILITLLSLK